MSMVTSASCFRGRRQLSRAGRAAYIALVGRRNAAYPPEGPKRGVVPSAEGVRAA
jgi:hypothetical protein